MYVNISLKNIAKRKNLISNVPFYLEKNPNTVEELIRETVKTCVNDYNTRKEGQKLLQYFSKDDLQNMKYIGKLSFGVNYGEAQGDYESALSNALQSFEDGIFRIFINNKEVKSLLEQIDITEKSILTFIRLTMLAGRMW